MKLWTLFLTCLFCFSLMPVWAAMKIEVTNVYDLVTHIGSHRELHLAPGTYDLGKVSNLQGEAARRMYNGGLMVYEIHDFKLVGSGTGQTKIISPVMESNVLTFAECSDIQVKDLSIGHRVVPGGCQGDAVFIRNSQNLEFNRTDIYGCGQYSLTLRFVDNLLVKDSRLHDCSYGLLDADTVCQSKFVNTDFVHTGKLSALNTNQITAMSFEKCRFFIDLHRKAFSYEGIPEQEYVAKYSLCARPHNQPWPSAGQFSFKHCQFSHVDPLEIELLKGEGVIFQGDEEKRFDI